MTRERAAVVVLGGPGVWKEIGERFIVGRSSDNELTLVDDEVGRRHARITWRDEASAWVVEDLGSTSGTLVNGTKIPKTAALADGDEVQIGTKLLRFLTGAELEDRVARVIMEDQRVDAVSGLATEKVFVEAIAHAAETATVNETPLALITVRIDDFARLTRIHGGMRGVALQRELGRLVKLAFEEPVTAARVGRARFVILVARTTTETWLAAETLVKMAFQSFFALFEKPGTATISAGTASFDPATGAAALVHASEAACEEAAAKGGNRAHNAL